MSRAALQALIGLALTISDPGPISAAPAESRPALTPAHRAGLDPPATPSVVPPPPVVTPLTVLPAGGVYADRPGQGTIQTEALDPDRTPHPEFHFVLRNDTARPVPISRLRGSCGCETLLLSKGGKPVASADLAPHEQVDVSIAVRIAGQHSGLLRKYAWVYGPGDTALATLEIDMTLREPVLFSPAFLNFTGGAQGAARSLPLTVTVDRSALGGGKIPDLVSSSPDVRVTPDGVPQPTERDGRPAVAQKYVVTLGAGAPSGRVSGALHFSPLLAGPSGAVPFSGQTVSVSGEVTGDLEATPRTLFFGSVAAGRTVTRQVVLTAASANLLRGLRLSSTSPSLTVRLNAPESMRMDILDVTLSGQARPGPLQEQVVVTSSDGQHLVLPVVALVSPPVAR